MASTTRDRRAPQERDPLDQVLADRWRPADDPTGPPVDEDVWLLHVRYARHRRPEDLRRLVQHHQGLTDRAVRRFARTSLPREDLQQVAYEALVGALVRFDPARRIPFAAYGTATVNGALKRSLRDMRWGMHLPRRHRERSSQVRRGRELLEQDLGRAPTAGELADWLDVPVDDVRQALRVEAEADPCSLDAVLVLGGGGDGDGDGRVLVGRPDHDLQRAEDRRAVQQALAVIPPRDRHLLHLYFGEERSQSEIARAIGVSQMHVSREIRRVVRRLQSHLLPA